MKMKKITGPLFLLGLIILGMTSCKKESQNTTLVVTDSISMPFKGSHFTLYSLSEGKVIPISDSATSRWDIGINFASIILNSHASGPGQAGVIVKMGDYTSFNSAPTDGYSYDTTTTRLAINSNPFSPGAWYIYDPVSHAFSPKAGLFFVIKTANGHFAKLEILQVKYADYDEGALYPKTLIYKFRFTYQDNGSANLQNQ